MSRANGELAKAIRALSDDIDDLRDRLEEFNTEDEDVEPTALEALADILALMKRGDISRAIDQASITLNRLDGSRRVLARTA